MSDDQVVGPAEYDDSDEERYVNRDSVMSAERHSRQLEEEQHERHGHHEKKHHEERLETTEDLTEVSQSLGNQLESSKLQVLEESYQPPSRISQSQHDSEIVQEHPEPINSEPADCCCPPNEELNDGTSRVEVEVIPGTQEISHLEQESHVAQETISVEVHPSVEVQAAQQRPVEASAPSEEAHVEGQAIPQKAEQALPAQISEREKIPHESHQNHHIENVEDPSHPGHNAEHKQHHQQAHHSPAHHDGHKTQQPHISGEHPAEHHEAHHEQPEHHEKKEHHQKPDHHEHLKGQVQAEVIPKQESSAVSQKPAHQHVEHHNHHAAAGEHHQEHHQERPAHEAHQVPSHQHHKTETAPAQPQVEIKQLQSNTLSTPKKERTDQYRPQAYRPPSILQRKEDRVQVEQISHQQLKAAQPESREKIQIQSVREKPKTQDKNAGRPASCSGCEIM